MKTKVLIRHRPDVDIRSVLSRALHELEHPECDHLRKDLQIDEVLKRMPKAIRDFYLSIRTRVGQQLDTTLANVTARAKEAIDAPPPRSWKRFFERGAILFPLSALAIATILKPFEYLRDAINWEQFNFRLPRRRMRELRSMNLIDDEPQRLTETGFKLGRMDLEDLDLGTAITRANAAGIEPEQQVTIDLLARRGARYVTDMTDRASHDIGKILESRDADLGRIAGAATEPNRADARDIMVQMKRDQHSWNKLRSAFRQRFGDVARDWDRIAYTELADAEQTARGIVIAGESEGGFDTVVYRIPREDACRYCKELYLQEDGTPRPFRLGSLFDGGSNVGRVGWLSSGRTPGGKRTVQSGMRAGQEADEILPVIGQTHPYCRCRLVTATEYRNR